MTYIGVDSGVAHSEGTLFVQQDATVSRTLIQFLLIFITPRDSGVRFLITPVDMESVTKALHALQYVQYI